MGNLYSTNGECYAACGAKGPDDCIWSDNLAAGRLGRSKVFWETGERENDEGEGGGERGEKRRELLAISKRTFCELRILFAQVKILTIEEGTGDFIRFLTQRKKMADGESRIPRYNPLNSRIPVLSRNYKSV